MKILFPEDEYTTPEDLPLSIGYKILLKTRWGFYQKYFRRVIWNWRRAKRGVYDDEKWVIGSYNIFKDLESVGGRFEIKGIHNLKKCRDKGKPVVLVCNHMSTLETMVFPSIIRPYFPVTFVVKSSLAKAAVFGPVMRSRDPIIVERKNPRDDLKEVLRKGQELISKGISIIIFPQSTRRVEFIPKEFNSLGIKLAKKCGVDALPIAIKTDFWGNGKLLKAIGPINGKNNPIHIAFGEPFSIGAKSSVDHEKTVSFIKSHTDQWMKGV